MVGWHHQLNRHESQKTLGDGEGEGRLACCSPWGHREQDMTEPLSNNTNLDCTNVKYYINQCLIV